MVQVLVVQVSKASRENQESVSKGTRDCRGPLETRGPREHRDYF